MKTNTSITAIALCTVVILAGCAGPYNNDPGDNRYPQMQNQQYNSPAYNNAPTYNSAYGVVDSIQVVQQSSGNSGIGAGTVVGGVVGGVLGNQIGKGSGRTAATAVGVVGGALVGNQIQRNNQQVNEAYQVGIRLDNGAYHTMLLDSIGDLRVGNRVRIENNRLFRY